MGRGLMTMGKRWSQGQTSWEPLQYTVTQYFDIFLRVFDRLGVQLKLNVHFTCLCSVPSLSAYTEQRKFSFTLLKTGHHININKSSTSHFMKVTLHDFTDLHVKLGFYGGAKAHHWKGGGMERNNRFILIIVFS